MTKPVIRIRGATQNNLKQVDLDLPLGQFTVITGVSGSGKSSLAFDTIYSEGQRRYVETFSPYARQFLDRMDKPAATRIEGIPPAIAIDQTNPVRTSRSTVGTMTELNDHLKLLYARAATAYCPGCAEPVKKDDAQAIAADLLASPTTPKRIEVRFAVPVPDGYPIEDIRKVLERQGYTRVYGDAPELSVVQGRLRADKSRRPQLIEALEAALVRGRGQVSLTDADATNADGIGEPKAPGGWTRRFSSNAHCAECDRHFRTPIPNLFSFNSPAGACPTCRGFGRTMGIDYALVIPNESATLAGGAVKPFQSESYKKCQSDLLRHAHDEGISTQTPWAELSETDRRWVIDGVGSRRSKKWYGVKKYFDWLETKAYRMHIRVLLSRYRSYEPCATCHGARLIPEALDWRLGTPALADALSCVEQRLAPHHSDIDVVDVARLPGLHVHDLMALPVSSLTQFFEELALPAPLDEATDILLEAIRARVGYLNDVGLGYLTLDRQSRTLSGGEVQRINLTTALGTSLVNTLFVLDEPSIGLHSRDLDRVTSVLVRLRDAGNTLLVVEHDPTVMLAADQIIDMGPGPGEAGGEVVFQGTPKALLRKRGSLTGEYLSGRRPVVDTTDWARRTVDDTQCGWLHLKGATENNLRDVDVAFPLERLVCVTGVSGSGKSTLVHDVMYQALRKFYGQPDQTPGQHKRLLGAEQLSGVVMVDQTPIGKTTRSNPASYVGALDAIRKRFAAEALSVERGYTAGTFSFNSGTGRCPGCTGNGFEHVEMQFLSDVYLRCPDCNGRRFRAEVLEVKLLPRANTEVAPVSVADVLEMTVTEALAFFDGQRDIHTALAPLAAVGLEYLRLGQPVPTLSGGEAQRLKLAGHLAKHAGKRRGKRAAQGTLFLLDEPTTGLHFHDIVRLLKSMDALVDAGHSLIVIEHNLDVVRHADWIIDLGPEGGDGGGTVLATGVPEHIAQTKGSYTGKALLGKYDTPPTSASKRVKRADTGGEIVISNAREHNLKGIDVRVPRDKLTVITGVSGSGKSTVAFDILFGEGQRRYLESLNAYARQFVQPASRPEVDAVVGLPPTVAIEQRTSRGGRKSTVGTVTEIHHFLRLLYVKLGQQFCPDCDIAITSQDVDSIVAELVRRHANKTITVYAPMVVARKGYYTDLARWANSKGYSHLRADGELLPTDNWPRLDRFSEHDIDLPAGEMVVTAANESALRPLLERALALGKDLVKVNVKGSTKEHLYSTSRACPSCSRSFSELDPRLFSYNSRHGWCLKCYGTGLRIGTFDDQQTGEESAWENLDEAQTLPCKSCAGERLNAQARAVRFHGESIAARSRHTVAESRAALKGLKLSVREATIGRDIVEELGNRLDFLERVGLGYLSLDRAAPTLSGGEAQRIRLAAQLGSNLRGVCYILDEPTIGLHPVDNEMLLDTLEELRAKGNTVLVVEHDEDTIRRAEHIIDLGPGAGRNGGELVAAGSLKTIEASPRSVTGQMLANPLKHPMDPSRKRVEDHGELVIHDAVTNNLKKLSLTVPLGRLVCVSGVSGSGKSTVVRQVLLANLAERTGTPRKAVKRWRGCKRIDGVEHVQRVLEVDQTPIGKTPRSCPATYIGIWDYVRRLFAETEEARLRGYGPARFSFNVGGGRCETCEGQGMARIEMNFLPDVRVPCERCGGKRFNEETLSVTYKDKNIAEVLNSSVEDAVEYFAAHPKVHHALKLLNDVGLGYLTLGQPSPTLSGGEAQRIKLVAELAKARPVTKAAGRRALPGAVHTLFVLDEPTTGLHMADVARLINVLHALVDAGHSAIVIEHNLDVIAEADHIIDMGPGGGDGGGKVVASGPPSRLIRRKRHTPTTGALAAFLGRHGVSQA
jgi:excinuclease ABC subunit A